MKHYPIYTYRIVGYSRQIHFSNLKDIRTYIKEHHVPGSQLDGLYPKLIERISENGKKTYYKFR